MRILFLPHTSWRTPQRFHFLTGRLAIDHHVVVTNWDAEFRSVRDYLSVRYLLNYIPRRWHAGGVTVQHIPRISPALFSKRLRTLNTAVYRMLLDRLVDREAIDVVVGTFPAPVVTSVPTVVDLFDDNEALWTTHGLNPAYGQEIVESENAWIRQSRRVVTVSSVLAEKVEATHPTAQVTHIPNGVDLGAYHPDRRRARAKLGLSPSLKYVGNIGALNQRSEGDRLLHLARRVSARQGVVLLVVGSGAQIPYLQRRIEAEGLTNTILVGFVSGDELVAFFQAIDIGLCPYRVTPGDDARVPMRLLHYSAVGAGVVSARLEEVRRMGFSNVLLCDDTDDAFADRVLEALDETFEPPEQIHSYDIGRLAARYEDVLHQAIGAESGSRH